MAKISIITVCLNNLFGLKKTIQSIFDQEYSDYELLIIDGGSIDGTVEYIKEYSNIPVRFISEKDSGIYNAQNKGIKLSNGDFLFFLNAGDTFINNNVLNELSDYLDSDFDIVYGDIYLDVKRSMHIKRSYPDVIGYSYWSINSLCHQAVFIRKSLFNKYGLYNESYRFAADFEFFQRVWYIPGLKLKHAPIPITIYDMNGISAQPKYRSQILAEYEKIKKIYFPWVFYLLYRIKSYLLQNRNILLIRILIRLRAYFSIFKHHFFKKESYNFSKFNFPLTKKPNVLHLSTFDNSGGASRAAYKLHKALVANGFSSRMLVYRKYSQDDTIIEASERSGIRWLYDRFLNLCYHFLYVRRFHTKANILHSSQRVSRISLKKHLEILKPDLVHIHWIGFNFISIEDLLEIKVPIIWTVHDMWSFCGAEHVSFDERFKKGYLLDNRPASESGFDLNRRVWERKKKVYSQLQIIPVGVSEWMQEQIQSSKLFEKRYVARIANPIETKNFYPKEKILCKKRFNLSAEAKIILFGAEYFDSNKGFDLLENAVKLFLSKHTESNIQFVSFGGKEVDWSHLGIQVINLGYIQNDNELADLYSAANVTLIPSRLESFCQIAAESIACGTPVVCFRTSGLKDVVTHSKTGYLADPFSIEDFAMGITLILNGECSDLFSAEEMVSTIGQNFSEKKIMGEYIKLYSKVLNI